MNHRPERQHILNAPWLVVKWRAHASRACLCSSKGARTSCWNVALFLWLLLQQAGASSSKQTLHMHRMAVLLLLLLLLLEQLVDCWISWSIAFPAIAQPMLQSFSSLSDDGDNDDDDDDDEPLLRAARLAALLRNGVLLTHTQARPTTTWTSLAI